MFCEMKHLERNIFRELFAQLSPSVIYDRGVEVFPREEIFALCAEDIKGGRLYTTRVAFPETVELL